MVKHIKKYIRISKEFANDHNNYCLIKEFDKEYRVVYLKECLIGESNISSSCSSEYIENVLKDKALIDVNDERKMKEVKKIKNMYKAIQNIFQNVILPDLDINLFDSSLSNSIHSIIGFKLIDSPGLYRQVDAKPGGEDFYYLPFKEISIEMDKLFSNTKNEINKIYALNQKHELDEKQIKQVIKVACQFLNRFLYIHPYTNGNGRTARILTSYLLSKISVVPVSLTEGSQKNTYLQCLREAHPNGTINESPSALATLLLERVFLSLEYFYKAVIF